MTLQEDRHPTPLLWDVFLLAPIVEIIHGFPEVNLALGVFRKGSVKPLLDSLWEGGSRESSPLASGRMEGQVN